MTNNKRPKKNKIYLNYPYRDDKEQCFDMLFWNEKFLKELVDYNKADDGIPRTIEIVEAYKQRLKDHGLSYDKHYLNYVKVKLAKIKLIIDINTKWREKEELIEFFDTGLDWEDIIRLGSDKSKLKNLEYELGTFRDLLHNK